MEYVLSTSALSRHYGACSALKGLSMHVPKGAVYGLVGKNGAGKTTLIRLICGLQRPSSGSTVCTGSLTVRKRLQRPAGVWGRWWNRRPSIRI